jgi:hypothetical protein
VSGLSYQGAITLTVTGTSGAATLVGNTLNIPTYTLAGLGGQAALSGTGFVKISGTTISYDNNTYATQTYVGTQIANLVDSSPSTLDTLNELAAALGDDPNFATTVATSIGTKQAQLNGTGFVKVTGTTVSYDNSTYLTTGTASSTYVPYTGATSDLVLGANNFSAKRISVLKSSDGFGGFTSNYLFLQTGSSTTNVGTDGISLLSKPNTRALVINYDIGGTNYGATLDASLLTSGRTYEFPNASGVLALTSNLSSYLPLSGGTVTGLTTFYNASSYSDQARFGGGSNNRYLYTYVDNSGVGLATATNFGGESIYFNPVSNYIDFSVNSSSVTRIVNGGRVIIGNAYFADDTVNKLQVSGGIRLTGALSGTSATLSSSLTVNGIYYVPNSSYFICGSSGGFRFNNSTDAYNNFIIYENGNTYTRGAATFSSSVTTGGNINVNSDGIFINRSSSGEPYVFFQKNGVNRGSIYGVTGGGLRVFDESDNQVLTITGTRLGISDPSPSRKLTVNFGTSVNDGLIVYGSQRHNTVFRSTGEHCFIYFDSHHADTFLPVLHLQRSSTTFGTIGLQRASNSDGIGAYAESEMVVGTSTTVPFSIQTNSQRRIRVASGGGVEVFNTLSVSDNLTARNFSRIIKYFNPAGSTGSGTAVTYNWADELAALAGNFDTGGFYKGFIRSGNGAHYHGYHFDILVGSIGYGGNSLQFKVQNITAANSAWAGGCGGSPFGSVDNTSFVHVNNPCGEVLQLSITKLGV